MSTTKHDLWILRTERGLSRREVAESIGCDPMAIYAWEKHLRRPNNMSLRALASFYGVPMETLDVKLDSRRAMRASTLESQRAKALEAVGTRKSRSLQLSTERPV